MGEGNALQNRNHFFTKREFFARCAEKLNALKQRGGGEGEEGGDESGVFQIPVEFIYLHGWHPSDSQAKPKARGSGNVSLKDFLDS